MKKKTFISFLAGLFLTGFAVPLMAVPNTVNFQGRLLENGVPVSTHDTSPLPMVFRLYDSASPGGGTLLYEETQEVEVLEGVYSIYLGSEGAATANGLYQFLGTAVSSSSELWVEVEVNGEILLPRQKFTSVPYAMKSGEAAVAVTVLNNSISTTQLADLSITSEKLADGSITPDKLADFCQEGEILVKSASGWVCGILAVPLCNQGDFIHCYTGPVPRRRWALYRGMYFDDNIRSGLP